MLKSGFPSVDTTFCNTPVKRVQSNSIQFKLRFYPTIDVGGALPTRLLLGRGSGGGHARSPVCRREPPWPPCWPPWLPAAARPSQRGSPPPTWTGSTSPAEGAPSPPGFGSGGGLSGSGAGCGSVSWRTASWRTASCGNSDSWRGRITQRVCVFSNPACIFTPQRANYSAAGELIDGCAGFAARWRVSSRRVLFAGCSEKELAAGKKTCSSAPVNIHAAALNIHAASLNIHTAALNVHTARAWSAFVEGLSRGRGGRSAPLCSGVLYVMRECGGRTRRIRVRMLPLLDLRAGRRFRVL
eukprot:667118-Prorocentrum_minimum.AAC.2